MIQRVQSIFLFVLGVCMILSIAFPSWQKAGAQAGDIVSLDAINLEYVQGGNL